MYLCLRGEMSPEKRRSAPCTMNSMWHRRFGLQLAHCMQCTKPGLAHGANPAAHELDHMAPWTGPCLGAVRLTSLVYRSIFLGGYLPESSSFDTSIKDFYLFYSSVCCKLAFLVRKRHISYWNVPEASWIGPNLGKVEQICHPLSLLYFN